MDQEKVIETGSLLLWARLSTVALPWSRPGRKARDDVLKMKPSISPRERKKFASLAQANNLTNHWPDLVGICGRVSKSVLKS